MKQFLIIQTAFLGDVILATPILSELKRIYPDAAIDVVLRKGNEQLLENNPHIRDVIVWNKKSSKYKSLIQIIKRIRRKRYDEVINLQRFASAGLMCMFSKATIKVGFRKNSFRFIYNKLIEHSLESGKHEIERNLMTIQDHGVKSFSPPQLFPSAADYSQVSDYKKNTYFCIAPASVWLTKQLPEEKWIELIKILQSKGEIYLLGSKADRDLCNRIVNKTSAKISILAGKLSILQSAALMKDARMNYVNDSGPQHIASAVNAPVRTFYCSTVPSFGFGPVSENSGIIQIHEKLSCRPCGIHGHNSCPQQHFKCGKDIYLDEKLLF